MPIQSVERPSNHLPRYDAVEVLMIAAGVLLVVAISFMF